MPIVEGGHELSERPALGWLDLTAGQGYHATAGVFQVSASPGFAAKGLATGRGARPDTLDDLASPELLEKDEPMWWFARRKRPWRQRISRSVALLCALAGAVWAAAAAAADFRVPILLYHRLGPTAADGMTLTTAVFEEHLRTIRERGFTVIPLRRLVDFYLGAAPPPPPKSVVIVEDDAHKSVYTEMLPLVKKYRVPVTVFVYPSAISNASYAMTWDQLRELKNTGLFDFQSHTYWHPNFKQEKKRLPSAQYEKLVESQLRKSKARLEQELGVKIDCLAWPFGITDEDLLRRAAAAGYRATFSIVRRPAGPSDGPMLLPRLLLTNADRGRGFAAILGERS